MLTIKPIEKKDEQKALCRDCGVTYHSDYFGYSAYDDGIFRGICQFGMRNGVGHVYCIAKAPGTEDFNTLFLLGRAALNFMDLCGVDEVYFEGEESPITLAVGFKKNKQGRLFISLNGFFDGHGSH